MKWINVIWNGVTKGYECGECGEGIKSDIDTHRIAHYLQNISQDTDTLTSLKDILEAYMGRP